MNDKVLELGRHAPSVESVITRLHQHMGKIKHITAIVEWNDGSSDICCDTKDIALLCYDKEILAKMIYNQIQDNLNER